MNSAFAKFREENPATFDSTTLEAPKAADYYLENRLWKAFNAGAVAGRADAKAEVKATVIELLKL